MNKIAFISCIFVIGCSTQNIQSTVDHVVNQKVITVTSAEVQMVAAGPEITAGKLLLSDQSAIYLSDSLGQQIEKVVTLSEPARTMALSPDGKRLAYFDSQAKLFIHDFDTGQATQPNLPFLSTPESTLEWASNGTELIFSCAAENLPFVSICSFNLSDENLHVLLDARSIGVIDGNTWLSFKSRSKDNSKIVFAKGTIPQFGNPNKDIIYILDVKTDVPTIVFDSHSRDDISNIIRVAISPDGGTILFDAKIEGIHQIFHINSDGTELRQITNSDFDTMFPFWSPGGGSFYAVVYEPNTTVSRLTLYNLNGEVINTISLENTWLWGWFDQ